MSKICIGISVSKERNRRKVISDKPIEDILDSLLTEMMGSFLMEDGNYFKLETEPTKSMKSKKKVINDNYWNF